MTMFGSSNNNNINSRGNPLEVLPESVLERESTVKSGIRQLSHDQSRKSLQSNGSKSIPGSVGSSNNSSVANMDAYAKYLKKATTRSPKAMKRLERNNQKLLRQKQNKQTPLPEPKFNDSFSARDLDDTSTDSPSGTASMSGFSTSGFSTYSFDTHYHTIAESTVAKIFGHSKVHFHGREREIEILRDIYAEVCRKDHTHHHHHHHPKAKESPEAPGTPDTNETTDNTDAEKETPKRSVVLVAGLSGTGKSALVREFVEGLKSDDANSTDGHQPHEIMPEPLFLSGKYNELAGSDPFSAIVEAFSGLSSLLLTGPQNRRKSNESTVSVSGSRRRSNESTSNQSSNSSQHNRYAEDLVRIQRDVRASLGREDVAVLTKVVPALRKIFSDDSSLPSSVSGSKHSSSMHKDELLGEGSNTQNAFNRLKYVMQLFARTIATHGRPIVLFLDDLQWIDNGSLELLQALLTDKRIRNFMLIGSYRSDEVSQGHPLTQRMARIQKTQPVETIRVGNLTVDELIDFLHAHMKIDPFDCRNLATKVHATTNGNMFYVIQILVELNQQCALIYSEFKKEWEWDDVAGMLVLETGLSENLEEAIEEKVRRSPKLMKRALIMAAYSRSTIDIDTLFKLLEMHYHARPIASKSHSPPLKIGQLSKALDRAVLEGFLSNNIGSKFYSFSHDKVLQASYALVPDGKAREKFRLWMGRKLYELGSSPTGDGVGGDSWMLFAAAEHLNSSITLTDTDPIFVARMNLDIGERASKVSAYDQASKCLIAGLGALMMIPDYDSWEEEYDLTLRLHRAVADVELYLGRFERGNEIGRTLLEKVRDVQDGLPTYDALAQALGREELHVEAMAMNRDAMIHLGEYPKHNRVLALIKEVLAVQRYLKRISDDDILHLPIMTDRSKDYALTFTQGLAVQAFYCDNLVEFLLASIRALRITFKYGLSGYSGLAILSYGLIISSLNDHAGALRATNLAKKVMLKVQDKTKEPMFLFIAAHFVDGWVDSHEKSIDAYCQSYSIGMEVGDVENAFMSAFHAMFQARAAGTSLSSVGPMTDELLQQMDLYNVKQVYAALEQVHVTVQQLTKNHVIGEPDWDELGLEPHSDGKRTGSENQTMLFYYIARVELGVYFGNYEFADQKADKLRQVMKTHTATIPLSFRTYYSGLAASGMAKKMRSAGKRGQAKKYKAKAKAFCKRLGQLNKNNGPINHHRELLLLADLNPEKEVSYDKAINACLEGGHLQDAALGSELAGEYYLSTDNTQNGTIAFSTRKKVISRHFTRARDLYQLWGAHAKVNHLYKTRGDFIEGRIDQRDSEKVVAIDIDEFSRNSSDDDFSANSDHPEMHNANIVNLLASIVPSSEDRISLTSLPDNPIVEQHGELSHGGNTGNDELSVISDIDMEPL